MKKYNITVNGISYEVMVEETSETSSAPVAAPVQNTAPTPVGATKPAPKPTAKSAPSGTSGSVKISAPMPGTILKIDLAVGQTIKKNDLVCILEAMKMENEIFASEGGTIASVNVSKGSSVNSGDVIISINP